MRKAITGHHLLNTYTFSKRLFGRLLSIIILLGISVIPGCTTSGKPISPPQISIIKLALDQNDKPIINQFAVYGKNLQSATISLLDIKTNNPIPYIATVKSTPDEARFSIDRKMIKLLKDNYRYILELKTPGGVVHKNVELFICETAEMCIGFEGKSNAQVVKQKPGKKANSKTAQSPNIILIIVDTLRRDQLGCYGASPKISPNIDKWAKEAVIFDNAYSHASWTSPSITSILTSLEPKDHHVQQWGDRVSSEITTIAEVLKKNGYQTAAAVSHSLLTKDQGYGQGFDHFDDSVLEKGDPQLISCSKEITDIGINYIDALEGAPFYMWLHYFEPHEKYLHHPGFGFGADHLDRYDSEIAYMDHHIGRLLDHLKKRGLDSSTIVAFVADHGEAIGDHGFYGHGNSLYDEQVHIPMMINTPGLKHYRTDALVSQFDLAPTLLGLARLPKADSFKGRTLPLRKNKKNPDKDHVAFFESYFEDYCLHGLKKQNWKLVHNCKDDSWQLFDLLSDPGEKTDVKNKNKNTFNALTKKLETFFNNQLLKIEKKELSEDEKQKLKGLGYL